MDLLLLPLFITILLVFDIVVNCFIAPSPFKDLKNLYFPSPTFLISIHLFLLSQVQGSLTVNLATLRYDSLFNYSGKLRDKPGREVVDRHFCRLRRVIQPLLEDRNEKRFQGGQLTYPYFLPRWVPNGVQT